MIQCIIFDCDGTLVDSEYLCNLALEIKLKEYGVEASAQAMLEQYRGGKLADILQSIEAKHQITLKEGFVPNYRILVEELFEKELKPCVGVPEFLSTNTLPVGVASSGPVKKIKKALAITGLQSYFGHRIFSAYQINSWKPEPDLYLHAAEKMGVKPGHCLVVEDSMKGLEAGLAAGMHTVLFDPANLFSTIEEVPRIHHMIQLQGIISQQNGPDK